MKNIKPLCCPYEIEFVFLMSYGYIDVPGAKSVNSFYEKKTLKRFSATPDGTKYDKNT
jgi:hypothetical protein